MIYKDKIREKEFLRLAGERGVCVSIYLPTTPLTQEAQGDRIALKNLAKEAMAQAEAIADKRAIRAMEAQLLDLEHDDEFWEFQAHGLAVLVTPEKLRTYRLAHKVEPIAAVSDRFHLKPLIPALRPLSAYVLALAQKSVILYEFTPSRELHVVDVPNLPKDFSDATHRTQQRDGAPARRLQGEEGARILNTQFVRAVEKAVHAEVSGSMMPVVLVSTRETQAIYRSLNRYDLLADESIDSSPESMVEEDLKCQLVPIVSSLRQQRIQRWVDDFHRFEAASRVSTDLAAIAKLASRGQVSALLVDADAVRNGTLSSDGDLTLADQASAQTYDIIDEIVTRVLEMGGDILAVRKDDNAPVELMPIAAILRWA